MSWFPFSRGITKAERELGVPPAHPSLMTNLHVEVTLSLMQPLNPCFGNMVNLALGQLTQDQTCTIQNANVG